MRGLKSGVELEPPGQRPQRPLRAVAAFAQRGDEIDPDIRGIARKAAGEVQRAWRGPLEARQRQRAGQTAQLTMTGRH